MLAKVRPSEGTPAAKYFQEWGFIEGQILGIQDFLALYSRLHEEGQLDSEHYHLLAEPLQQRVAILNQELTMFYGST